MERLVREGLELTAACLVSCGKTFGYGMTALESW